MFILYFISDLYFLLFQLLAIKLDNLVSDKVDKKYHKFVIQQYLIFDCRYWPVCTQFETEISSETREDTYEIIRIFLGQQFERHEIQQKSPFDFHLLLLISSVNNSDKEIFTKFRQAYMSGSVHYIYLNIYCNIYGDLVTFFFVQYVYSQVFEFSICILMSYSQYLVCVALTAALLWRNPPLSERIHHYARARTRTHMCMVSRKLSKSVYKFHVSGM